MNILKPQCLNHLYSTIVFTFRRYFQALKIQIDKYNICGHLDVNSKEKTQKLGKMYNESLQRYFKTSFSTFTRTF